MRDAGRVIKTFNGSAVLFSDICADLKKMEFLPTWPFKINDFLLFGLLLGAGILGGHLASRTSFLPRISGYIAAGFVLGPSVLGLLNHELLGSARLFTDIALGLILFELGRLLDLPALRRQPWLVGASLLESALSFLFVYAAVRAFGVSPVGSALIATIGISSSPAVILLVTRQLGARGPVTQNAITLVALNNIIAFFVFIAVLPILHIQQQAGLATILLQPVYQFIGSALMGLALARALVWAAKRVGPSESVQFALVIGTIIATLGLAKMLNVSGLLALLTLGLLSRNLDKHRQLLNVEFGHGGELFFLLLFVVTGANLHLEELGSAGLIAVAFVAARLLAKLVAVYVPMRRSGLPPLQSGMLGLTLVPMAGLAIGLTEVTSAMYPQFGRELAAIVLAAVALLETIGPILTTYALKKAGEVANGARVEH